MIACVSRVDLIESALFCPKEMKCETTNNKNKRVKSKSKVVTAVWVVMWLFCQISLSPLLRTDSRPSSIPAWAFQTPGVCHLVSPDHNSLWFLPDTQSLLVHMQCWFKLLWFIGWHFVFVDMIINSATCPVTFLASFMNYFETDRLLVWEWWNGKSFNCIIHVSGCVQLCTTPMGHFCHLASIFINWCFRYKLNT